MRLFSLSQECNGLLEKLLHGSGQTGFFKKPQESDSVLSMISSSRSQWIESLSREQLHSNQLERIIDLKNQLASDAQTDNSSASHFKIDLTNILTTIEEMIKSEISVTESHVSRLNI